MPTQKENSLGTITNTASVTSLSLSVTATASVGHYVLVAFYFRNEDNGNPSCSDARGNTYTRDVYVAPGVNQTNIAIFRARVTTALQVGDNITVSWTTNSSRQGITAISVSGITDSSPLDRTASANGTSTAPDSGLTAVTTQGDEFLFGVIGGDDSKALTTFTKGADWTQENSAGAGGGNYFFQINTLYRSVLSTGQYKANGSWTDTYRWGAGIATYKASVSNSFVSWIWDGVG